MTTVRISDDAVALACGADDVARAFEVAGCTVERVSSWGMHWLEPLAEIDGIAFGPLAVEDVDAVLQAVGHPRAGGDPSACDDKFDDAKLDSRLRGSDAIWGEAIAAHPFIAAQQRLTFARAGKTRSLSLADYEASGGWGGLRRARSLAPEAVVTEVTDSGLRGRGGAGFPAGIKW
ncbi:MAG: hypothetical protein EOP61_37550, partial [Sphingomonadales bacterium]